MDIYDIDGIVREALHCGIDISPADRKEWAMFCCALKVLGFDEATFVALSSGAERDSRRTWRAERSPQRYKTEEAAKGMIVELAKQAGMEVKRFLLSPYQDTHRKSDRRPTYRKPTAAPKGVADTDTPKPQAVYITSQQVRAAQAHAHETSLYIWLCREFDRAEVDRVFSAYRVGGAKYINPQGGRAAAFPYIDTAGRCVDCKIFHVNPLNGSRHSAPPLFVCRDGEPQTTTFALSSLLRGWKQKGFYPNDTKGTDIRADWCNFGDHLLAERPNAPIGVVESEKSALILSLTYPEIIWIAVGSKQNLNAKRFAPYRGRKVTIYPDRDGYSDRKLANGNTEKGWRTIARELAAEGFALSIDTTTERHYPLTIGMDENGEPKPCKNDIADLVIDYRKGQAPEPTPEPLKGVTVSYTPEPDPRKAEAVKAFEEIKQRYPYIAQLAEALQLEPISVEPYNPENR